MMTRTRQRLHKNEEYADVICYNCGDPGHHKAGCTVPKSCFICKRSDHGVDDYPVRSQPHHAAKYIGSSATSLGFYHILLQPKSDARFSSLKNIELAKEFRIIYKTSWPWLIRQLDSWSFLVKFPPHIKVEDVANYPYFGLMKEGVSVNVSVWEGELDAFAELPEIWIHLRGLQPNWCEWDTLDQFATPFWLLLDVDWQGMFKSFFEVVRIKIRCKDITKIPLDRLFGIDTRLHQIKIQVEEPIEGDDNSIAGPDGDDGNDGNGGNDGKKSNDNAPSKSDTSHSLMDTDKNNGSSGGNGHGSQSGTCTSRGKVVADQPISGVDASTGEGVPD